LPNRPTGVGNEKAGMVRDKLEEGWAGLRKQLNSADVDLALRDDTGHGRGVFMGTEIDSRCGTPYGKTVRSG